MKDQAEELRRQIRRRMSGIQAETIAVISGKGGVGKSNFALNFAITLTRNRKKVLLFDLDIGMGNIDLLLGRSPDKTIVHYFTENCSFEQIIQNVKGLDYIAGGSGLNRIEKMNGDRVENLFRDLEKVIYSYDYLIFDFGAGISDELIRFLTGIEHIFVVVTPEPTSVMDAYSAIKVIQLTVPDKKFYLLGNRMKNKKENDQVLGRLQHVMLTFLNKECEIIGFLPEDPVISRAVKNQIPFILFKPNSQAAKNLRQLTGRFLLQNGQITASKEENNFVEKLKHFLLGRQH